MNRSAARTVNVNREFTFTEIINKALRIGASWRSASTGSAIDHAVIHHATARVNHEKDVTNPS